MSEQELIEQIAAKLVEIFDPLDNEICEEHVEAAVFAAELITNHNREKAVEAVNSIFPDTESQVGSVMWRIKQAINKALGGSDEHK